MSADLSLFDKVRLAREGAAVERCHTAPHTQRYSVGHHSMDLITLVTLCWQADHQDAGSDLPPAALLVACAFHDVPERVTGDIPSVVKARCGGELERIDECVLAALGVNHALTAEERAYLEWGDRLELYLWCCEEATRGNTVFEDWRLSYANLFADNSPHVPRSLMLIMQATWGQRWHEDPVGVPRLTYQTIKQIVGFDA